jgi:hypothetical protein
LFVCLQHTSNFSAIHYKWQGCKFRPMFSTYGF